MEIDAQETVPMAGIESKAIRVNFTFVVQNSWFNICNKKQLSYVCAGINW